MTLNKIASNVERWQTSLNKALIAIETAKTGQIRLQRRLDSLTVRVNRLKAKIAKNLPYKTFFERSKSE